MPDIIGSGHEHEIDEEMAFEPHSSSGPSFLQQALKKGPESSGLPSAPKFVPPTSFYGQAAPRPKSKGPLFLLEFQSLPTPFSYRFPDMMLQLLML
jgi:hypothetical protein